MQKGTVMPDDVQAALERFQSFIGRLGLDAVIDKESGFTTNDAELLIGEIEIAAQARRAGKL
jgi:hypothetical protein